MKKLQKLSDSIFQENGLNPEFLKKIIGGDDYGVPTAIGTGWTGDCSTHTAGQPGQINNDGCDSLTDTLYKNDPA
jgi:hypothetical protein